MLTTLVYILFVFAAIVLVTVILLQEGKGGGFGEMLGTAGAQTFGPSAKGIHVFTAATAVVFMISALGVHFLNRSTTGISVLGDSDASMSLPVGDVSPPLSGDGDE